MRYQNDDSFFDVQVSYIWLFIKVYQGIGVIGVKVFKCFHYLGNYTITPVNSQSVKVKTILKRKHDD